MNCIETKKNIEALLDGELDDAQKDAGGASFVDLSAVP
jgi:hypothetical protein